MVCMQYGQDECDSVSEKVVLKKKKDKIRVT